MGDVRAPLTTFAELGEEGRQRVAEILPLMREVESLTDAVHLTDHSGA